MAEERRVARIEKAIQKEIATALSFNAKDPRAGKHRVTVTRVTVTSDLSLARIFYTVLGDENARKTVKKMFEQSLGYYRTLIAKRLDARTTPSLLFQYDDSLEKQHRVLSLIDGAIEDDRKARIARGEAEALAAANAEDAAEDSGDDAADEEE